jgi:hypothetical protein
VSFPNSLSSQPGCTGDLFLDFSSDLFGDFIGGGFTLPNHVDVSATIRVRLWW